MKSELFLILGLIFTSSGVILIDDVFGDKIIDTIDVSSARDIAVNPITNLVYVTNISDNTVSVIDGSTNTVIETIDVDSHLFSITVNPTTNKIYTANQRDGIVSVIDGYTNTVTDTIAVGTQPRDIVVNPITNLVYVTNHLDASVSVIDGSTNTVIKTINVDYHPGGIAVNPITNLIYVTNQRDASVSVIDGSTNTVIKTVDVGAQPRNVAVNPITNLVYVVNTYDGDVSVIDGSTNTVIETIDVDYHPVDIAVNPITNLIYTTSSGITVIDGSTNTGIYMIDIEVPLNIELNPITNLIYVIGKHNGIVSVIGTSFPPPPLDPTDNSKNKKDGCSGDCTPPTFGKDKQHRLLVTNGFELNGNGVNVEKYHVNYDLITVNTGQTYNMKLKVYENTALRWIQVGFGIPEVGSPMDDAEVIALFQIGYDDVLDDVEIFDNHTLIDVTRASLNSTSCSGDIHIDCYTLDFDFIPRDTLKNNVILIQAVDMNRNVANNYINDGMFVIGDSMNDAVISKGMVGNIAFYPQRAGTVELTLTDYKTDTWKDVYGYLWEYDHTNKTFRFIDTISPFKKEDVMWSAMTRMNSNFADMIIHEQQRAMVYYPPEEPFSDMKEPFSYEYTKLETNR